MNRQLFRKYISFLTAIVILSIAVNGFCRSSDNVEFTDAVKSVQNVTYLSAINKQLPLSPGNKSTQPDHCSSTCYCSCHAPLTLQPVRLCYSPQIDSLLFYETFQAIPEVYLSKFIPPQIFV